MALGGRVHLLLQHPLEHRRHRPLRPAEDRGGVERRLAERVLGDLRADPTRDALRSHRPLVPAGERLAVLLGAVGLADGHANDPDRVVDAAERDHARQPAAAAHDHRGADPLAQDQVRAAELRQRVGCGLEAVARLADPCGRVPDDSVRRSPPGGQRAVEALERDGHGEDARGQHPQRLLEQLLARPVTLEHDDGLHRP